VNKNNTKVNNKKGNSIKKNSNNLIKVVKMHKKKIIALALVFALIYAVYIVVNLVKNPTDTLLIEKGQIYQEEATTGYVIRDEMVLKGENYRNGMSQIKTEGERVAKGEAIFRYYSNGEEGLVKKIHELDLKIDEAMSNEKNLFSSDTKMLENQISEKLDKAFNESDLSKIKEYKKEINTYITKKAKIAGDLSPAGSYLKKMIDERSTYENQLNSGAEYLNSPISGVVSYRVDGYEEILKSEDFGKITKDFLQDLNLRTGQIIATSNESGKIIDNYKCYIATIMESEYAKQAKVGDKVKIRLSSGNEVPAEIEHINLQEDILIFKIEKCVEELIDYRKISFSIIWWSDSGMKIPNSSIAYEQKGENEVAYIVRVRAGYQDKVLINILRKNEKYSIVANYTSEELEELGYNSKDDISSKRISVYDEILIKP